MSKIAFDIMLNGKFVCTMRMEVTPEIISGYIGDIAIIKGGIIERFVEKQRLSLIGKPYRVCF